MFASLFSQQNPNAAKTAKTRPSSSRNAGISDPGHGRDGEAHQETEQEMCMHIIIISTEKWTDVAEGLSKA